MMLLTLGKTVSKKIFIQEQKSVINDSLMHLCTGNHSLTEFIVPNGVVLNVLQCSIIVSVQHLLRKLLKLNPLRKVYC